MGTILKIKRVINKANGQISISLPKKQLTKDILNKIEAHKYFKLNSDSFLFG